MEGYAASRHGTWLTGKATRLALVLLMVGLGTGASMARPPALIPSASSQGAITVCPGGPPECAYSTIQAGIDAGVPGDTVLVLPGVYVEQVVLKTGVTLRSTDGREPTVITNSTGPIVSATSVEAVSLHGLTIRGQGVISPAIGIDLVESELAISDCVVDGIAAATGQDAYGIRAEGSRLTLTRTDVRHVWGGDGTHYPYGAGYCDPRKCEYYGGSATGIGATEVRLTVQDSAVEDVRGGLGCYCHQQYAPKSHYAGDAFGLWATGGKVNLHNSAIRGVSAQATVGGPEAIAVCTSGTAGTYLRGNVIENVHHYASSRYYWSLSDITAISSTLDAILLVSDNTIRDLIHLGPLGSAAAVRAADTDSVVVIGNQVVGIGGGPEGVSSGVDVARAQSAVISSNTIGRLTGYQFGYPYWNPRQSDRTGADVVGIRLQDTSRALLTNNAVWKLLAGSPLGFRRGGHALAVDAAGGSVTMQGNTLWGTTRGPCPSSEWRSGCPEPWFSVGLRFNGTRLVAVNNAIISHTLGISTTVSETSLMANNDLWHNEVDYADGVTPGHGDLHLEPAFADPENGDLHLLPFSPLIDAGSLLPPLLWDFEGDLRPMDGDDDGFALPDIGADEYVPWSHGCALPLVLRTGP